MATLAVIPARLAATRLPRKPLRMLGGRALIVRVWERVTSLDAADACVVATDSPEIADAVAAVGAEAVLTRSDHPSGTDRVAEVAAMPPFQAFDTIVNVQGDEPFITAEAISGAAGMVRSGRFEVGTVAAVAPPSALSDPNIVKVVLGDGGRALYFSRAGIPHAADSRWQHLILRHLGVYAYTREALARWVQLPVHPLEAAERLEQLRPLAAGMPIGVTVIDESWQRGIDTEEDLVRANEYWDAFTASAT